MFRFDMAVISKEPTPPSKPSDLDVRVRSDKSLEIRWAGQMQDAITATSWSFATFDLVGR